MTITKGITKGAVKIVIYGPEGIGKSTFASKFPGAVFIDTEGSTKYLNVARFDEISSWDSILAAVDYAAQDKEIMTLVIDTADWAELMCMKKVCQNCHVNGIEDIGYGKGYVYLQETFKQLLDKLDICIANGINVVITAHAKMRKFEQPDEMGAYDRWEMKLTKQVAPMVKEWADTVLFANYKTIVVTDEKTKAKKGQGGKRVMYATHHPCWDAKNRFGLEDQLDFDFSAIADYVPNGSAPKTKKREKELTENEKAFVEQVGGEFDTEPTTYERLKELMDKAKISDEEVEAACVSKGLQPDGKPLKEYESDFIEEKLIAPFDKVKKYVERDFKGNPFIKHYEKEKK